MSQLNSIDHRFDNDATSILMYCKALIVIIFNVIFFSRNKFFTVFENVSAIIKSTINLIVILLFQLHT